MCLFVLGQGSILDSYNLIFRGIFYDRAKTNREKNWENKKNWIYDEVAMYYDIL
jgi:hypothetical protein